MMGPYENGLNKTLAASGRCRVQQISLLEENRSICMFACYKNVVIIRYAAKCMFVSFVQVLRSALGWSQFKELGKQHSGILWYFNISA